MAAPEPATLAAVNRAPGAGQLSPVPAGSLQADEDLRMLALRMRNEMQLKERIIHLQTFKYTFTGQQAVTFLTTQQLAPSAEAAADVCQRMLAQGLFKSIYHRDAFAPDGEVYRFSSSMLDGKNKGLKGALPGSITSTGLYKEIAKFGKTAAQPFKNIQLSLNDTFNSLGNLPGLSIPAGPKASAGSADAAAGGGGGTAPLGMLGGGGRAFTRSSSSGRPRSALGQRRSQAGKGAYGDAGALGHHGADAASASVASLLSGLEGLQAGLKDSTGLLRLDLQQHTALQEHLVKLLVAQQEQSQLTQLLIAANAAATLLALLMFAGSWPVRLLAGTLLAGVLCAAAPQCWRALRPARGGLARGGLARGGVGSSSSSTAGGMLERRLSKATRIALGLASHEPGLSQPAGLAKAPGETSSGGASDAECGGRRGSLGGDADDWEEDSAPSLEDIEDWPDAPMMLCPDPATPQQVFEPPGCDAPGPCRALPLNEGPIPFETPLFRGVFAVFIRHLPTTPPALFKGKKRLTWIALQGTFKRPVCLDSLVFGMEFERQLVNLPAPWFIDNMLLPLARKISPALRVGSLERPYFYSPLITASQIVHVSLPGEAPPLMEATEDLRLVGHLLGSKAGDLTSVSARRKYFQAAPHRQACAFTTDHVWTFHLWQEYVDYAAYELNLGYSSYELAQHLDGQPLQMMIKDTSNSSYLLNLLAWHTNLVRCCKRPRYAPPARVRESLLQQQAACAAELAPREQQQQQQQQQPGAGEPGSLDEEPRSASCNGAAGQQQGLELQQPGSAASVASTAGEHASPLHAGLGAGARTLSVGFKPHWAHAHSDSQLPRPHGLCASDDGRPDSSAATSLRASAGGSPFSPLSPHDGRQQLQRAAGGSGPAVSGLAIVQAAAAAAAAAPRSHGCAALSAPVSAASTAPVSPVLGGGSHAGARDDWRDAACAAAAAAGEQPAAGCGGASDAGEPPGAEQALHASYGARRVSSASASGSACTGATCSRATSPLPQHAQPAPQPAVSQRGQPGGGAGAGQQAAHQLQGFLNITSL